MIDNKVSVIVAVYNVERYIHRCVDSLLSQTYQNIEVILVDDGSTDSCPSICDEYAHKDSRVHVVHKHNEGVSAARQTGLDAASGDYVIHADPDDYVDKTMIEELMQEAIRTGADIVTCDFFMNDRLMEQNYTDSQDLLLKIINVSCICVCWNCLVKRSFIVEHGITFRPKWLIMSEDFLFIARLLSAGALAAHVHKAYYHYFTYNPHSLTYHHSMKKLESIMAVIHELEQLVDVSSYDNLYSRKKYAIMYAYQGKMFHIISRLYPEIHQRLIDEGSHDEPYGLGWQLAHAMKHPVLTFYLSSLHSYLDKLLKLLRL